MQLLLPLHQVHDRKWKKCGGQIKKTADDQQGRAVRHVAGNHRANSAQRQNQLQQS